MHKTLVVLILFACIVFPATALADWHQPVGGASPINESASKNGDAVALTTVGGVPYITWNEDTTQPNQGGSSQIRVARLAADGSAWTKVADGGTNPISRQSSTSSHNPSIAAVGSVPWVAWSENITQSNAEIRVARLAASGTSWERVDDSTRPINHLKTNPGGNADVPTIADDGSGRPFVSFMEADPGSGSLFFPGFAPMTIWVDRLSAGGSSWNEVGGAVSDTGFDAAFPKMALVGGVPWLTYFQVALVQGNPQLSIAVAHLSDDGQSWVHLPAVAAGAPDGFDNPTIAAIGGRPVVAYGDKLGGNVTRVRVVRLNDAGDGWDELGGGPASASGQAAQGASLAEIGGAPWVAWRERGGGNGQQQVRVARLNGSSWQMVGTQINDSATHDAGFGPSLSSVNGFPWVAFAESDNLVPPSQNTAACCYQERVSRLEPVFADPSAQATSTTASLVAEVRDTYGLPFPIGFSYAPRGGSSSTTPTTTAASDPDVFFRTLTGLTPGTLYTYEPFATAGTPAPTATGAGGLFVTPAASDTGSGGSGALPGPPGAPGTSGGTFASATLAVGILRMPARLHRGATLRVKYLLTGPARLTMLVRRRGHTLKRMTVSAAAGVGHFSWRPRRAFGRVTVTLWAQDRAGHAARDIAAVRVLR